MIPVPPLHAIANGQFDWSEWFIVDSTGEVVCRGMDRHAAQWIVMVVNEYKQIWKDMIESLYQEPVMLEEWIEYNPVQLLKDKRGREYKIVDNQA